MGTLRYSANMSADGYTVDTEGKFDWAMPSDEVHAFINEMEADVTTYVLGRDMYRTMVFWETYQDQQGASPVYAQFADLWRRADKFVASSTLPQKAVTSQRTRIVRDLRPADLRRIADERPGVTSVGGPTLAAEAIRQGLVDDFRLIVFPEVVGGGRPALPPGARLGLRLTDIRAFSDGCVYLRYAPR
ncbi:dihydrofolate reductase family protein [Promicromonospora sp. NPDC052451]|uniref:dihydrofolate reductase family protein n=1 Tax=unclassified Promicromonospora TaxID=2647929 RepID=UPI0037C7D0DA